MAFSPYKQICDCGHDIATHYEDPATGVREACLGLGECKCRGYHDHLKGPRAPITLRVAAPKVLENGARVRVTDAFSPHYCLEGEVFDVWEDATGKKHVYVEIDDYGRHWFPESSVVIL